MFCTGGIRCEKSTAYLKEQGFDEVYHLEGGILKYLEEVKEDDSKWQGDCFVFDNRVAVGHELKVGEYELCHACRKPLSVEERKHEHYVHGVSCHHCIDHVSEKQRARFKEREKQMRLAQERGELHLGTEAKQTIVKRRKSKLALRESQRKQEIGKV